MDNNTVINGRTYTFGILPATEALFVEVAVARVIGEPLFKAFTTGQQHGKKITDEEVKQMGGVAIGLLATRLDADELLQTMKRVFMHVQCDGEKVVNLDKTFTGRNRDLWEVFLTALKFNFGDFFSGSLLSSIQDKVKAAL